MKNYQRAVAKNRKRERKRRRNQSMKSYPFSTTFASIQQLPLHIYTVHGVYVLQMMMSISNSSLSKKTIVTEKIEKWNVTFCLADLFSTSRIKWFRNHFIPFHSWSSLSRFSSVLKCAALPTINHTISILFHSISWPCNAEKRITNVPFRIAIGRLDVFYSFDDFALSNSLNSAHHFPLAHNSLNCCVAAFFNANHYRASSISRRIFRHFTEKERNLNNLL